MFKIQQGNDPSIIYLFFRLMEISLSYKQKNRVMGTFQFQILENYLWSAGFECKLNPKLSSETSRVFDVSPRERGIKKLKVDRIELPQDREIDFKVAEKFLTDNGIRVPDDIERYSDLRQHMEHYKGDDDYDPGIDDSSDDSSRVIYDDPDDGDDDGSHTISTEPYDPTSEEPRGEGE